MKKLILTTAGLALVLAACGGQEAQPSQSPSPAEGQEVAVTAVDYAFEGVPTTLQAGETRFVMENVGEEPHMIFFARIEGTSMSLRELLRLSEKESDKFVEEVGGIQKPVAPGKTGEVTLGLEAGRYVYVCFISAPDGEAHYEKGMVGELTVE